MYSEEIETRLLNALWYYSAIRRHQEIIELIPTIPEKLFYDKERREVFAAVKKSIPNVDYVQVVQLLHGKIAEYRILEILGKDYVSIEDIPNGIQFLKMLTFQRMTNEFGKAIQIGAQNGDVNLVMSNARAIEKLHNILSKKTSNSDYFREAIELSEPGHGFDFIPTVFPKINSRIVGFSRRELSSLGGKPGHHKTGFVLFNATESLKQGLMDRCHFVSVEHPGANIAMRVLAKEMKVPYIELIKQGHVFDRKDALDYMNKTYGKKLIITDKVNTIARIAEAVKSTHADQHIIDHAQELIYDKNDMFNGINELLLTLKPIAAEQRANILILSQVNDKIVDERADSKIPKSHDFYNSSRIKQESRQIFMTYWEYQDLFEANIEGALLKLNEFQVICYKSTYTGVSRFKMKVNPEIGVFE